MSAIAVRQCFSSTPSVISIVLHVISPFPEHPCRSPYRIRRSPNVYRERQIAVPHTNTTVPHIIRFPQVPNHSQCTWESVCISKATANWIKDFPGHCSAIFQGLFFFAIAVIVGLYQSLHLHWPVSTTTTRQACDMTHGGSGQFFRRLPYVIKRRRGHAAGCGRPQDDYNVSASSSKSKCIDDDIGRRRLLRWGPLKTFRFLNSPHYIATLLLYILSHPSIVPYMLCTCMYRVEIGIDIPIGIDWVLLRVLYYHRFYAASVAGCSSSTTPTADQPVELRCSGWLVD